MIRCSAQLLPISHPFLIRAPPPPLNVFLVISAPIPISASILFQFRQSTLSSTVVHLPLIAHIMPHHKNRGLRLVRNYYVQVSAKFLQSFRGKQYLLLLHFLLLFHFTEHLSFVLQIRLFLKKEISTLSRISALSRISGLP